MPHYTTFFTFILSLLLLNISELRAESADCEVLPDEDLFRVLIADTRESQFSMRREEYRAEGDAYSAAAVSFGDYLPIVNIPTDVEGEKYQILIDGSLFALFNLDTPSYNLINTDYAFGLSLAHSDAGNFSSRLRLFHMSSHVGDEFLIDNPDFERENASYENLEYLLSYRFDDFRVYGGAGYILRAHGDIKENPLSLKTGLEYKRPLSIINNKDIVFATNFHAQERSDWRRSVSVMFGISLAKSPSKEIRLMSNYYSGNSIQGQFYREKLQFYGLGIYLVI